MDKERDCFLCLTPRHLPISPWTCSEKQKQTIFWLELVITMLNLMAQCIGDRKTTTSMHLYWSLASFAFTMWFSWPAGREYLQKYDSIYRHKGIASGARALTRVNLGLAFISWRELQNSRGYGLFSALDSGQAAGIELSMTLRLSLVDAIGAKIRSRSSSAHTSFFSSGLQYLQTGVDNLLRSSEEKYLASFFSFFIP